MELQFQKKLNCRYAWQSFTAEHRTMGSNPGGLTELHKNDNNAGEKLLRFDA